MGEGKTGKAFLRFLKELFRDEYDNISFRIHASSGGSPEVMLKKVIDRMEWPYTKAFILLDKDKPPSKQTVQDATRKGIVFVQSNPCIEGLFLSILEPAKDYSNEASNWCKRKFEDNYLDYKMKLNDQQYKNIFTREVLLDARDRVPALNQLLTLMFLGEV